jgi:hypothetical protein
MSNHSRTPAALVATLTLGTLLALPAAARAQGGAPAGANARTRVARPAMDSTGVADTSMFAPLDLLPSPSVYRSGSGAPGPRYWQQRADYDLRATLDTAAKTVRGEMTLRYTNNSPDTLRYVWMQVEQNAVRPGSLNSLVFPADSRFGARNFVGGDVIERFNQLLGGDGRRGSRMQRVVSLKTREEGTVMKVDLAEPLAPGRTATFDVAWHFMVPEHGADRMGREGALYEIAQWYPRLCVYDDVRGWNTEPYLGQGEFYLEYGDYTMAVTVPAGYVAIAVSSPEWWLERATSTSSKEPPSIISTLPPIASSAGQP